MIGRKGIRDALLAAVLFGLSAPVAKILVGNLSPQLLAGLLYIGSGIGLTILALVRSGTPNADQTEIRGHYRRVATSNLSKREESGDFRIYRSSHGRAIVLHYPEYTVHVTSATTRPKITTQSDVLMVFSKASEMIIDFSEIPF